MGKVLSPTFVRQQAKHLGDWRSRLLLFAILSIWVSPGFAAIHQCLDKNGVKYFSDLGCPVKQSPKKIREIGTSTKRSDAEIDTSLFEEALRTPPGFGLPDSESDTATTSTAGESSHSSFPFLRILLILLIVVVAPGIYIYLKKTKRPVVWLSSTRKLFLTPLEMSDLFQSNLEQICENSINVNRELVKEATLVIRANNLPYQQAVRVDIDELTVGFLTRPDAQAFRKVLKTLDPKNRPLVCLAKISDDWKHTLEDLPRFTVLLDLPLNQVTKSDSPIRLEPRVGNNQTHTSNKQAGKTFNFKLAIDTKDYPGIKKGDAINFISIADSLVASLQNKPDHKYQSLGLVPKEFSRTIKDHQEQGLPVEAKVSNIKNGFVTIHCKRVSVDEYETQLDNEREHLKQELAKKYFPSKPFSVEIFSSSNNFDVGDALNVLATPSLDDMIAGKNRVEVLFDKDDIEDMLAMNQDITAIKKVFRLFHTHKMLDVKVTSKENVTRSETAEPRYRYLLSISPSKREVS